MRKILILFFAFFLFSGSTALAGIVDSNSNFQASLSGPSPLAPPEKFISSMTKITSTAPYKAVVIQRNRAIKMDRKTPFSDIKKTRDLALSSLGKLKSFIKTRNKAVSARITQKSRDRLYVLNQAASLDLETGYTEAETLRASAIARKDVELRTSTTVANIKANTSISLAQDSIKNIKKTLKKKGLSRSSRRKLEASLVSLNKRISDIKKSLKKTLEKINKKHQDALRGIELAFAANRKIAEEVYAESVKQAESATAEEEVAAIQILNAMTSDEMKKRNEVRFIIAKHLTRSAGRVISLGSPTKPPLAKPSKPKVSKKDKIKAKKKARSKARKIGKQRLKQYREELFARL